VFSILESGNKTIPLVADGLFDLLMNKMTSIYTSKKQTKIESKGPRFEIGDFCVKLGSVTMSQNFKGVLVEVRVHACSADCREVRIVGSLRVCKSDVRLTAHRNSVWIRKTNWMSLFCIHYFSSNSCSTCFGQPCAHHQELTTA